MTQKTHSPDPKECISSIQWSFKYLNPYSKLLIYVKQTKQKQTHTQTNKKTQANKQTNKQTDN